MAYRSTITLRDADYEALDRLKTALDMPTSQTLAVAIRVVDMVLANQKNNNGTMVLKDRSGKELEHVMLTLASH